MKVGFTVRKERQEYLATCCDRVVYLSMEAQTAERFYTFIKNNLAHELYVESISDIGLQLVQLARVVDLLKSKNKKIHFMNQENQRGIDAADSFDSFAELVNNERYLATYRTYRGREQFLEKEEEKEEVLLEKRYMSHTERLCYEIEHASETEMTQRKTRPLRKKEILYGAPLGSIPKFEEVMR